MYSGIMTPTLISLCKKYEKKWGHNPCRYEDVEYGAGISEYIAFVRDIKKALELGVELPDLYPDDEGEF